MLNFKSGKEKKCEKCGYKIRVSPELEVAEQVRPSNVNCYHNINQHTKQITSLSLCETFNTSISYSLKGENDLKTLFSKQKN